MIHSPVFVVGVPRSGTTLLQSLLSTSPDTYSLPETHFFEGILPRLRKEALQPLDDGDLEGWAHGFAQLGTVMIITYEQLQRDTALQFINTISFLQLPLDLAAVESAMQASSFTKMRKVEKKGKMPGLVSDRGDGNALRVREGKVGGYRRHLTDEDVAYIAECRQQYLGDSPWFQSI